MAGANRERAAPALEGLHDAPSPHSPYNELARLAALHDEAAETALLANLLGRAPYMSGALAAMALLTLVFNGVGTAWAETGAWLFFVFAATAAILKSYSQAIRAPFERASLQAFREDMKAVTVYAGFGWGAGAFLTLQAATGPTVLALFAVGAPLLIAAIVRDRDLAIGFLAPAAVLCALAALLRPLAAGATGGLGVVLAATVAAVAILAIGRKLPRSAAFSALANFSRG